MLRSCCLACCLRTPERGASPALWIHLPGWLGSHAGSWSQPGFWILVCLFWCCWLNGPFFLKTIAGLAVFARRSVEPARLLGTCRLSTMSAPCCVEKLLPGLLSSHAGAWSQPGFWILVCLFLCCWLNGPFFLKTILPGWLCSHAGAWSQPGF